MSKSSAGEPSTELGTDPQTMTDHLLDSWQESYNSKFGTEGGMWLTLADIADLMDYERARREIERMKPNKQHPWKRNKGEKFSGGRKK